MVDEAGWAQGSLSGLGLDVYTIEVQAGQRYRIELLGPGRTSGGGFSLWVEGWATDPLGSTGLWALGDDSVSLVFSAEQDQALRLALSAWGAWPQPADYRFRFEQIGADDHGDFASAATPLPLGRTVTGLFDGPGDVDCFALELEAGVLYDFGLAVEGADLGSPPYIIVSDAEGRMVAFCLDECAFLAPYSGRFTLQAIQSGVQQGPLAYQVRAEMRAADDHADAPSAAEPLAVGSSVSGGLDRPGDVEVFRLDLRQGQGVEAKITLPAGNPMAWPSFVDAEGKDLAWPNGIELDGHLGLRHVADQDGPVFLRLQGFGRAEYRIDTRSITADDHADGLDRATPLMPGIEAAGKLDGPWDRDVFAFEVIAGHSYRVELEATASGLGWGSTSMWLVSGPGDPIEVEGPSVAGGRADAVFQAATDGRVSVSVQNVEAAGYRLRVVEPVADDHADGPLGATPLRPGQDVTGRLEGGYEVDWFSIDIPPGTEYRVMLDVISGGAWSDFILKTAQGFAYGAPAGPSVEAAPRWMRVDAPQDGGPLLLSLSARTVEASDYVLWLEEADDGYDTPPDIDHGLLRPVVVGTVGLAGLPDAPVMEPFGP